MTSYGDPRAYGRAQPSGGGHDAYHSYGDAYDNSHDAYSGYTDPYARDSYGADPYPYDPYQQPAAPVGTAAGGAAAGSAAVGRATGAAAPVSPGHRYDWSGSRGAAPVSPGPSGSATGRASVRPPGSPGPGGPGGPPGPGGGRPGGGGDGRPPGRRKRIWIRNTVLSGLAVAVMLAGGAMVALSYYVDEVRPPEELELNQASSVHWADGSEAAVLQEENRELINTRELTTVQNAVIAAEDKKFWEHSGVDFVGIMRAAWNNFTGGEIQGASTITQQYARIAGDLHGQTYQRKLEEAAMAYKLSQKYERAQILDFYLNTVYFGRGAYGIEAAAEAYFGTTAEELTVAQAALLAGIIRYPDDGSGFSPYDPMNNPDDPTPAQQRWSWVIGQMVDMGTLTPAERDQLEMPEVIEPPTQDDWSDGPKGPIIRQVQWELEEMGITDLRTGGYRITTTIDPEIQDAAQNAARRKSGGPLWGEDGENQQENIDAALVAIDPNTGAVLGYYGGEDGTAYDLAGRNKHPETGEWYGGRPPGSSFKIYTLISMLRQGISFDSHWKTSEFAPDYRPDKPIRNAGRVATSCEGKAPDYCTLRWSTEHSYNVPFMHFSLGMGIRGPQEIVDAAKDAGVGMMTGQVDGEQVVLDLASNEVSEVEPLPFFHEVAFGQYAVTVLDHAAGTATLAAEGVYHKPHFVEKVEQRNENGEWEVIAGDRIAGDPRVRAEIVNSITGVLTKVPGLGGNQLAGGRPAAGKTGTWEHPEGGTADAWMTGYTPQIAATVWVGDGKDNDPITDPWGSPIASSGLPSQIWKQFMDEAHAVKELPHEPFPPAPNIGDPQHQLANGERPEEKDDRECWPAFLCPDEDDEDDDEDDEDNGGGGGGDLDNAREEETELLPWPGG